MANSSTPAQRTAAKTGRARTIALSIATAALTIGFAILTGVYWWATITASPWTPSSLRTTTLLAAASATISTATFVVTMFAVAASRHPTNGKRGAAESTATLIARLHLATAITVAALLPLTTSQEIITGLLPVTLAATTFTHVVIVRDHTSRYQDSSKSRYPIPETISPPPPPNTRPGRPASAIRSGSWRDLL